MSRWRPLAIATAAGLLAGAATAGAAALSGMAGKEVLHLTLLVLPPLALTIAVGELLSKRQAVARERETERQRRDLITAMSHDLRTPLASVRAMAEAIDEQVVNDPETMRRYGGEMRRSITSMSNLVDDLFELAQLEAGAIELEARRATVGEVVDDALAACGPHAERKGLRVETALGATGGTSCSPRLGRVLQNLIQNAIRHTPADGTVRIEATRGRAELRLVVSDTGEGIPADGLKRVFDPFWRGDPARGGDGSGLGLALCAQIVESLGGQIRVDSRPAHGASFAVVVPNRG
jgi:signal transduction histidine kinase